MRLPHINYLFSNGIAYELHHEIVNFAAATSDIQIDELLDLGRLMQSINALNYRDYSIKVL